MRFTTAAGIGLFATLALAGGRARGQIAPLQENLVPYNVDSGKLIAQAPDRVTVYSTIVRVAGVNWIRLQLGETTLGASPGEATVLRITSLADGAVQHHDAETLAQWGYTSAYFNGDAVRLELISDPDAAPSRLKMSNVLVGPPGAGGNDGGIASICGPTDDRLPSMDPRACRAAPIGCTAWMISDFSYCFLTAGHCAGPSLDVMQFNVPESQSNGNWNFPGPEDQYAVDGDSLQFVNGGIGNDWAYFGCFPNTETDLTPFEAQGMAFDLVLPPPVQSQTIRITGYGTDTTPPEWNQIQQTHTGPYISFSGSQLQYRVDTTGGNSGSPVINENTGEAIGIHTHAGCSSGGGANNGTGANNGGLQSALADPQGVCLPAPGLGFSFPDGIPTLLDPGGDSIRVEVSGTNGGIPEAGSGMLHYDLGGGYVSVPMQVVSPGEYDAVFPEMPCGSQVLYYFSAQTTEGETVTNPLLAPEQTHASISAAVMSLVFRDDFEADTGWGVVSSAADGQWERGTPIPNSICDRGNPGADADGSGQCYLTDNDAGSCNSDVDGGYTILTSPMLDTTLGVPALSYWRWYSNVFGDNPMQDVLHVEVSDDGGFNWTELETVGPGGPEVEGGWYRKFFVLTDVVQQNDSFQVRFTAEDAEPASVVEAAIDGVELLSLGCQANPMGDVDGDGIVGILDLLIVLGTWGPCPDPCPPTCAADLDGDCEVGIYEFLVVLGNWD